ncbi:NUMOD4 [uncultured Caudovirales phage]|uniref:NUMOD4 n=1 Tax=uncultured Caudovirales phage TaxID=2100421 RepID=A0A6J5N7A1_9CAUD|nr:NUMOD4 [uncultured Caudovirales phage]
MEIWNPVKDYEGLYEVSSLGRVISVRKNKILKPILNGKYFKVSLSRTHKIRIHQLVANVFLGHNTCGMKLVVDHINGDCLDNRLSNIQVVTQRENVLKSIKFKK